jgi:aminopeptidase-like protein
VSEHHDLDHLFDRLFPILRSITGPGYKESLAILGEAMPLTVESVPSGTRVFDWTVPPEWHLTGARLTGPDGQVYADAARSSLEVLNFSTGIDAELELDDLEPHLHSIPALPDAVPYVTSYYRDDWGFCLPDAVRQSMPREGRYHAKIDAEHRPGTLDIGSTVLPGESSAEILLTTYLCHPSLANNELSGPLVMTALHHRLERRRRRFTYRFVVNPETIGSLCYLRLHADELQRNLVTGLVLTCLGGPEPKLSYQRSRRGDSLLDRHVTDLADVRIREFTPLDGSDERQYCSPGFNLPVGQLARTIYGQYDGYHNSRDTKAFMTIDALIDAVNQIDDLLLSLENAARYRNLAPYGEPHLSSRGLYPTKNSPTNRDHSSDGRVDQRRFLDDVLMVLCYSDGMETMADIARRCGCTVRELAPAIDALEEAGLLAFAEEGGGR